MKLIKPAHLLSLAPPPTWGNIRAFARARVSSLVVVIVGRFVAEFISGATLAEDPLPRDVEIDLSARNDLITP